MGVVLFPVLQVINPLKGHTKMKARLAEVFCLRGAELRHDAAHLKCSLKKRRGFECMGVCDALGVLLQVLGLPLGHAEVADRLGQCMHQCDLLCGLKVRVALAEQFEGFALQGIAHQQGRGFIKLLVATGLAAAKVIVVHAGQVVVHQGISVHQFDGQGRRIACFA